MTDQNKEALEIAHALAELDAQFSRSGLCLEASYEISRLVAENTALREAAWDAVDALTHQQVYAAITKLTEVL